MTACHRVPPPSSEGAAPDADPPELPEPVVRRSSRRPPTRSWAARPASPWEAEHLGLAHELGNRVMAVSAQLQLVAGGGQLAQEQVDAVRAAERALEALVATGERLVALAGLAPPAVPEVVDLQRLARDVVTEAESVAGAGRSRVTVLGSRPAPVLAVRSQLRLLVDNLVENALKYSPAGSPVVVEVRPHRGGVVLRVLDRGVGIAARDLPHVQEPYFRSPEAQESDRQGAGMGLAIARALVERHGGHLGIDSRLGLGTRVTVLLPPHLPGSDVEQG